MLEKKKHLNNSTDHQPLGLPRLGARVLCFMFMSQPVGCGISRNVDKTSESFCFHRSGASAQPLTFNLFRNLSSFYHLLQIETLRVFSFVQMMRGEEQQVGVQPQCAEVDQPLCYHLLIKEVLFSFCHGLVSVWKHQHPFPGPCLLFFFLIPFPQMHNPNYILSHSCLLFQYKIIICCEVWKFQTLFGSGPMV